MQSKFWAAGSESSDSDTSVQDLETPEVEATVNAKGAFAASRWAAADISSSEDEGRVVKSLKDRRWSAMREITRQMQNHMKICDFAELYRDYDQLVRAYNKAAQVIEVEGIPNFFIRQLTELDFFLEEKHKDREAFKKLAKSKALALNTLRSKVRKTSDAWAAKVDECKNDPSKYETLSEDSDDNDIESESDLSEDSDDSGSYNDDSSDGERKKEEGSDSGSEWKSESEGEDFASGDVVDRHKIAMVKWGFRAEGEKKKSKVSGTSSSKKKTTKTLKVAKDAPAAESMFSVKDMEHLFDVTDLTPELMRKRVIVVVEKRGRRGVDRFEQTKVLKRLAEIARGLSSQCHLEVLGHLISAEFDTTSGVFTCLSLSVWLETFENIKLILEIVENVPNTHLVPIVVGDDDVVKDVDTQRISAGILTSFIERLDDELTKSLQFTDVHSDEYKERLGRSVDILAVLWRAFVFLDSRNFKNHAATAALRINEHMHYKHDRISMLMWELVKKQLSSDLVLQISENEHALILPGGDSGVLPTEFVEKLTRYVFVHSDSSREKTRALLHIAYSKSLHDHYFEARDLLHTPNIQELATQIDIPTQILYNRNLVQLGLCAFRNGLILDAHSCLSQVCPKHKELLAQGISSLKNVERTPEQERAEKRRLLPYHMHISMELIEGAHNICAMLLEVPQIARDMFETRKRVISKHFRRMLELYDRQVFLGPPENPRETVMAATRALQRGDWSECCRHIFSLPIWEKMLNKEQIQEMLKQKVKEEAMRTYIFTYLMLYDSFSIGQLCSMFDLTKNAVHSIVSKMMVNEEIHASWDETSNFILMSRVEHTRLQQLAITLAENVSSAVEQNELTLNMKNPKFALTHERRFQMRDQGDRYGWGNRDKDEGGNFRGRGGFRGRSNLNPVGARGGRNNRGRGGRGRGGYSGGNDNFNRDDRGFRFKFGSTLSYN